MVITQPQQEQRLCVARRRVLRFPLAEEHEVAPPRDCDLAVVDLSGTVIGSARIVGDHLETFPSGPTVAAHWLVRGRGCVAQARTHETAEAFSPTGLAGASVRFVRPRSCTMVLRDPLGQPIAGVAVEVHDESSYTLGFQRAHSDGHGTITWHDLPDSLVALRLGNTAEPWHLANVDLTKADGRLEVVLPTSQSMRADVEFQGKRGLPADATLECKNGAVTIIERDATRGAIVFDLLWRDPTQPVELDLVCSGRMVADTVIVEPGVPTTCVAFHFLQRSVATPRVEPPADGWLELRLEKVHDGGSSVWSQVVPGRHGRVLPPFTNLTPGRYRLHDVASDSFGPTVEVVVGQQVVLELDLASVIVVNGRVVTMDHHDVGGIAIVAVDEHGAEVRRGTTAPDGRFSLRLATRGRGLLLAAVSGTSRSAVQPLTGPLSDVVLALPSR